MSTDLLATDAGEIAGLADPLRRFDAALPRFLAEKRAPATRTSYARALDVYREHCAGADLSPFGGDAVQNYNAAQRRLWQIGELAADTVRLRLTILRAFLTWAHDYGLTAITPAMLKRWLHLPPARELSPRDILTPAEVERLLAAAKPGRDRLLLRTMLDAGLRVSEAIALTAQDVYTAEDRCYIHVAHGKGEKPRDPEIPPDLFAALRRYAAGWRPDRRLFDLDAGNAWRLVQRTAERAGLDKAVTPHSLRHTHAHHLRLAGVPLEVVSHRLGHASIETTKTYTRPAEMARSLPLPPLPWQTAQP